MTEQQWPPPGVDWDYHDDYTCLVCADCRDVLPVLPKVETIISDPPYGMSNNTDSARFSGGHRESVMRRGEGGRFEGQIAGDAEPFDPAPWLDFPRVVLFGSNHFAARLPVGTTLVWLKRLDAAFGTFLSDAEVAWMKGGHGVYCYRDLSMTALAKERKHPNQKPVSLMQWCMEKVGGDGLICDPYCGSGTTLRAAKDLRRRCIGIELERKYVDIAIKRLAQEVLPL